MSKTDSRWGWIQTKARTRKDGSESVRYIARITPPGEEELTKSFVKKGRPDEPGTAEYWLAEQRETIRKRQWTDPRQRRWTVGEWADAWVAAYTGIDQETRETYRRVIDLDIKPSGLGDDPIETVDRLRMGAWMNELATTRSWAKKPLAASTIAGRRTIAAMMFGAAVEEGIIPRSPMTKVRAPQATVEVKPVDPEELPTPELVWKLYDCAEQFPEFRELIIVAAGTGLRPGELLGIKPGHIIDNEVHVLQQRRMRRRAVVYGTPKAKSRRRVPIGNEVQAALERQLKAFPPGPGDVVFRGPGGEPWRTTIWTGTWRIIRRTAGVPKMRFYVLRHYYASVLINGGASPKLVMERLGHTNSKYTLERYARLWHDSDEVTRTLSDAGLARQPPMK
ncbi:tyrosine-type recombinase/integrase [Nocardia carnea]|uniref:tyrosine-type recombinase/integrase n=1 Tax=Nocardia carnea TaxID=37328 RepID=UPI00245486D5|nr:site-specific integrase [Nocardia carnea]